MSRHLLLLLLIASPVAFAKPPSIDKVNGAVRTDAGQMYDDLETVNGSIRVARAVQADEVSTVNGGVDVDDDAVLGTVETVNGGVDIARNVTVRGNIETVNGGIRLDAGTRVEGGLETVNGGMRMTQAVIERGLATVNGSIEVGQGSTVRGGILVEKPNTGWFNWANNSRPPRIVIGPNAVVDGELRFEREVELFVHDTAKIGPVTGATAQRYSGNAPPR